MNAAVEGGESGGATGPFRAKERGVPREVPRDEGAFSSADFSSKLSCYVSNKHGIMNLTFANVIACCHVVAGESFSSVRLVAAVRGERVSYPGKANFLFRPPLVVERNALLDSVLDSVSG